MTSKIILCMTALLCLVSPVFAGNQPAYLMHHHGFIQNAINIDGQALSMKEFSDLAKVKCPAAYEQMKYAVEEDGSAFFRVPANMPIAVQPLDEQGRALQLMRSWFAAMPGETLSCIGCHEKQNMTPPSSANYAARRAPSASCAPSRCPTSVVAALAKPRPGRNESDSMVNPT